MEFKDVSKPLAEVASQYHVHRPSPELEALRDQIVKIWRQIGDFLNKLFRHSGSTIDSHSMSTVLQIIVAACGLAALILALLFLAKKLAGVGNQKQQLLKGATEINQQLDAAGWRKKADQLAAGRDYRGACRATYLSLLQDLDEQGIAPFSPTKTNYEYGYALSRFPQLKEEFRKLADLVDILWFGSKTAQQEDYGESRRLLDNLDGCMKTIKQQQGTQEKAG